MSGLPRCRGKSKGINQSHHLAQGPPPQFLSQQSQFKLIVASITPGFDFVTRATGLTGSGTGKEVG